MRLTEFVKLSPCRGFDIAAILGAMLACAKFKKPFVIDGFITAVAAACAVHMNERIVDYALPSHHSREKAQS